MRNILSFITLAIVLTMSATLAFGQSPESNPNCSDFGYNRSVKLDPPDRTGNISVLGFGSIYYFIPDGKTLEWSTYQSPAPFVRAVIVKGGNGATVKHYNPLVWSDTNITAPINSSGSPADISHVSWCYNIPTTAAPVTLSGRVLTRYNRAISGARVSATDMNGVTKSALTNTFGYYKLELTAGDGYVLTPTARGYTFGSQFLSAMNSISDFNFVAQ